MIQRRPSAAFFAVSTDGTTLGARRGATGEATPTAYLAGVAERLYQRQGGASALRPARRAVTSPDAPQGVNAVPPMACHVAANQGKCGQQHGMLV